MIRNHSGFGTVIMVSRSPLTKNTAPMVVNW